jgi:hypothetical protein
MGHDSTTEDFRLATLTGSQQVAMDRSPARQARAVRGSAARRALLVSAVLSALLGALLLARFEAAREAPGARGAAATNAARAITSLPAAAQGAVSARLGAESPSYRVAGGGDALVAGNRAQRIAARFTSSGVTFTSGALRVGLALDGVAFRGGHGSRAALTPRPVRPSASANRVEYARAGSREWYVNGPLGIEQGFTIARPPSQDASPRLTLSIAISGNARASLASDAQSVTLTRGASALRYGSLTAIDARGRSLPARLASNGRRISIELDTSGASYPLQIDPLIGQGGKLTGAGESGEGQFGLSVAISADGDTALIGGPHDEGFAGSVWAFTRTGSTWSQQGAKLTSGAGEGAAAASECDEEAGEEAGECGFGRGLALSADGDTALIGAPRAGEGQGAVWVFTRSGESGWSAGEELTGGSEETREGHFGRSVALSADGATALIGAPADKGGHGAAWAFARSGGSFSQVGPKLTGEGESGEGRFGGSLALSGDGRMALVGAPGDSGFAGAAWAFSRSGSTWTEQGAKLAAAGELGAGRFGASLALAADGESALIGARADNGGTGAVWSFANGGSGWSQQGEKLVGAAQEGAGEFGYSVALSGDGGLALIGAPHDDASSGAVWRFTRSEGAWAPGGERFTPGEEGVRGWFGASVALSSDGVELLIGDPHDNARLGSAWTVLPAPAIARVEPGRGPAAGGTTVTIGGVNFTSATAVRFGSAPAASFTVDSPSSITAVSPAGDPGTVAVTVTTPIGASEPSSPARFKYVSGEAGSLRGGDAPAGADAGGGTGGGAAGGVLGSSTSAASACKVTLRSKRLAVRSHTRAALRLLRTGAGACRGRLTLRFNLSHRGRRAKLETIGTATFSISPGKSQVVTIKLNAAGRALLSAHRGRLNASLAILRLIPAPTLARTASVRLNLQKPHRASPAKP